MKRIRGAALTGTRPGNRTPVDKKGPTTSPQPRQPSECRRAAMVWLATVCTATVWLMLPDPVLRRSGQSFGATADVSISPSVASLFIGQEKIVEGTVAATQREGNVVRLLIGTPPQTVTVSLVIGLLSKYPSEPERYYLGKTVRVAGTIQDFRHAVEIELHDAALIEVVEAPIPQASAPDTAPVKPDPQFHDREAAPGHLQVKNGSVQRRLDTLNERIRVLERKVQQLENAKGLAEEP